jgi:hypothetical protein
MGTLDKSPLIYEILAYLVEHPGAQDTLAGIVEWWLLEQHITRQTTHVKAALAELVAQELLQEHTSTDLRVHYRINQDKYQEIQVLLKQKSL